MNKNNWVLVIILIGMVLIPIIQGTMKTKRIGENGYMIDCAICNPADPVKASNTVYSCSLDCVTVYAVDQEFIYPFTVLAIPLIFFLFRVFYKLGSNKAFIYSNLLLMIPITIIEFLVMTVKLGVLVTSYWEGVDESYGLSDSVFSIREDSFGNGGVYLLLVDLAFWWVIGLFIMAITDFAIRRKGK